MSLSVVTIALMAVLVCATASLAGGEPPVTGPAVSEAEFFSLLDYSIPRLVKVRDAVDAVLALPNPPTAICFSNDDLAIRAMDYLISKGVRIPEDVSVLGYDNIDISNDLKVPLSSIAQDYFEMAKSATNILLLRVDGSDMPFPLQVFMKPKLVRRSSVRRMDAG
jgi:DNA-binding LacI/PurR family transcriptional regulator